MIFCPNIKHPDWISAVEELKGIDEPLLLYYKLGDRIPSASELRAYKRGHSLSPNNNQIAWNLENKEKRILTKWNTLPNDRREKVYARYTPKQINRVLSDLKRDYKEVDGRPVHFQKIPIKVLQRGKMTFIYEIRVVDETFRAYGAEKIFGKYANEVKRYIENVEGAEAAQAEGQYRVVDGEVLPEDKGIFPDNNRFFSLSPTELEAEIHTLDKIDTFLEKIGVGFDITDFGETPALASANFQKWVVEISNKVQDRASAWNQLPEEAAHFWYRLLKNSDQRNILSELILSHKAYKDLLTDEQYQSVYEGNVEALAEEAIGKVIGQYIVRIDKGIVVDRELSFWEKFVSFIRSVLGLNVKVEQLKEEDRYFFTAAQRILNSDLSDLMTPEEYRYLESMVTGYVEVSETEDEKGNRITASLNDAESELQRLFGNKYKRRTRFLPRTIMMKASVIQPVDSRELSEREIERLKERTDYTLTYPTLFSFDLLRQKFKKNKISLSSPINLDGVKKDELKTLNHVLTEIKEENPNLKSIEVEDFINEVIVYLKETNVLGFGIETLAEDQPFRLYRFLETFGPDYAEESIYPEENYSYSNKNMWHRKISIRFDNKYIDTGSHFPLSPVAWANWTPFKHGVLVHEIQNDFYEAFIDSMNSSLSVTAEQARDILKFSNHLIPVVRNLLLGPYADHIRSGSLFQKDLSTISSRVVRENFFEFIKDLRKSFLERTAHNLHNFDLAESNKVFKIQTLENELEDLYRIRLILQDVFKKGDIILGTRDQFNRLREVRSLKPVTLTGREQRKADVESIKREMIDSFVGRLAQVYGLPYGAVGYQEKIIKAVLSKTPFWNLGHQNTYNKHVERRISSFIAETKSNLLQYKINLKALYHSKKLIELSEDQFSLLVYNLAYNLHLLISRVDASSGSVAESNRAKLVKEMNYFTPLVHYTLQHAINNNPGKKLYFSGWEITNLTQTQIEDSKSSTPTADLYAGPEEVAKGFAPKIGVMWSNMNKIRGIKLKYVDHIPGFAKPVGGYEIDVSNYNYNQPLLYSLKKTSPETRAEEFTEKEVVSGISPEVQKKIDFFKSKFPDWVNVEMDSSLPVIARLMPKNPDGTVTIKINPLKMADDTLGHEFGHILIDLAGGMSNPMIRAGRAQLVGTEIEAEVINNYQDLVKQEDERIDKEILATAVGMETAKLFAEDEKRNKFEKWLVRFFRKLRTLLGIEISVARELAERMIYDDVAITTEAEASSVDLSKGLYIQGVPMDYYQDSRKTKEDLNIIDNFIEREHKFKQKAVEILQKKIAIYEARGSREKNNVDDLKKTLKLVERQSPTASMLQFVRNAVRHISQVNDRYISTMKREDLDFTIRILDTWRTYVSAYDMLEDYRDLLVETRERLDLFGTEEDKEIMGDIYESSRTILATFIDEEELKKRYNNIFDAVLPVLNNVIAEKNKIKNLYLTKGKEILVDFLLPNVTVVEAEYREAAEREYNKQFKGEERTKTPFEQWWGARLISMRDEIREKTKDRILKEFDVAPDDISQLEGTLDTVLNSPDLLAGALSKAYMKASMQTRAQILQEKYDFADRIEALEKKYPRGISTADEDFFDWMLEFNKEDKVYTGHIVTAVPSALMKDFRDFKAMLYGESYSKNQGKDEKGRLGKKLSDRERSEKIRDWLSKAAPLREEEWYQARVDFLKGLVEQGLLTARQVQAWEANEKRTYSRRKPIKEIFEEKERAQNELAFFEKTKHWEYRTLSPYYESKNYKWRELQKMRAAGLVNGKQTDERIIFYDFIIDKLDKAHRHLPNKYRIEYRLPGIVKSLGDRMRSGDKLTDIVSLEARNAFQARGSDVERGSVDVSGKSMLVSEANEPVHLLPVHYVNPVDIKEQSFDIPTLYYNYLRMSMEYDMRYKIQAEFELAEHIIKNRDYIRRDSKGRKIANALYKKKKEEDVEDPGVPKPGSESNLAKQVENFLKINLYGITKEEEPDFEVLGLTINRAKLLDGLSSYTALSLLGFNVVQGFANISLGEILQTVEVLAGQYVDRKSMHKATIEYYKNFAASISDIGKRKPSSLVGLLLDEFDTLNEYTGGKLNQTSRFRELMKTDSAFFLSHAGEHYMQSRMLLAMLERKEAKDKDGKVLGSMLSQFTVEDGRLVLNKEVDNFTAEQRALFGAEVKRVLARLHGEYSREGMNALQMVAVGRMAIMFRKFVVPGFKRRWEKKRYNEILGDYTEGNYRTFGRFFGKLMKDVMSLKFELLSSSSELTKAERANVIRTLGEIGFFLAILALSQFALQMRDDDDENEFLWSHVAYQTLRLRSELAFFLMPSEAMKILRSPMATISSLENAGKLLAQLADPFLSLSFEFEEYQQGSWKGKPKIVKTLTQLTPGYKQIYRVRDIEDQLSWWDR